jgi:DNA polymerase-3 subunit alpha
VRARIQSVEALDRAAAGIQKGLRIFLRDDVPLEAVAKRLHEGFRAPAGTGAGTIRRGQPSGRGDMQGDRPGDGEINLVMMLQAGAEVELRLPGRFQVNPQVAGAIKAVPGVVEVQAM